MDHYLAIIQTILDRCENDNTSPSINDMEIIKIGNYIPVYTSLSIIITNSHKLIGIEFVRNKERR